MRDLGPRRHNARYILNVGGTWKHRDGETSNRLRLVLGPSTVLVPLDMENAVELFMLLSQNRDHLARWLPWLERIRDLDTVHDVIRISKREQALGMALRFGIWHEEQLVGVITLDYIDRQQRQASVGYWLDQNWQGYGLVSASVAALCRYAMGSLGLCRLEISTAVGNGRSRRVAERLGFRLEGILRCRERLNGAFVDHALYSLTTRDPLPELVILRTARASEHLHSHSSSRLDI